MQIAVCGKGGSRKSTIVALLANETSNKGYQVLAIEDTTSQHHDASET